MADRDDGRTVAGTGAARETVFVDTFTGGVVGPSRRMLGPVRDGGHIVANTAPGCWGPMLTPAFKGGHEVTEPVAVEGAEVGDAIVIRIKDIQVTSIATASGVDQPVEGRFLGDPYVAPRCPGCGTLNPPTRIEGTGPNAIRCAICGAEAAPFRIAHGYTMVFDSLRRIGVTVGAEAARRIGGDGRRYMALPPESGQNPVVTVAPSDLVGVLARVRPFLGHIGTTPAIDMPDSHNAGDFGSFLIGAPHEFGIPAEKLEHRTDAHLDIDSVRAGAVLICPVKVRGGGVYLGDMHAMQGDGEIAGHTTDVAGTVTLQVHVLKGLNLDGPVLLPNVEDLPPLARPFTAEERARALPLARQWGVAAIEESAPIQVVGSGPDLNSATDNGLRRMAALLDMSVAEVRNRATITGGIEIGRHPGIVTVTLLAPLDRLERKGLLPLVREQYGIG